MTSQQNKEFLKISDMLKVTRTQFWKLRKAGEAPTCHKKSPTGASEQSNRIL